ncbi:MAG: alpha/beta fold hydrolase [Candidatus Acidiferrum sp.]
MLLLAYALAMGIAADCQVQTNVAGDWYGSLQTAGGELHLVLHITGGQDGVLGATLDSVDQNANGIPVTKITLKGSELEMTVSAVHGSYDGKVNADGTVIKGVWFQGQPLNLEFNRMPEQKSPAHGSTSTWDLDDTWLGSIDAGAIRLRIVFHIRNTPSGLAATMDSPDQGAMGIPVTSVTREGSLFRLEMKQIDGKYEGQVSEDKTSIVGTWIQRGNSTPLVLKPLKDKAGIELKRPQNPVRPYPYREEEVSYENKVQGDKLAGTLTVPPGKGPFPAVLLITGSGPQDRDESLLGHKPFLVLSDYLTRRGIVVLRADDRGVGKSTGTFATGTTADFATDVEAGVEFLKSRAEVDPHKIGLIGHSEGGIIAPMVAARNHDVDFIVMMAGSGVPGAQILVEQTLLISEANGMSKEDAEKNAAEESDLLSFVVKEKDSPRFKQELHDRLAGKVKEPQLGAQLSVLTSPWFEYFLAYDPAPALRQVKCSVLALNGELDLQVRAKQNLPAIRKSLEEGGNRDFEIDELPGLNHLFQTAKTGAPSEYSSIEETMSPIAMEKIGTWILKTCS